MRLIPIPGGSRYRVELEDGATAGFVFQYPGGRAWVAERRLSDAARVQLPDDYPTPERAADALAQRLLP